jgi:hypothetical protein
VLLAAGQVTSVVMAGLAVTVEAEAWVDVLEVVEVGAVVIIVVVVEGASVDDCVLVPLFIVSQYSCIIATGYV